MSSRPLLWVMVAISLLGCAHTCSAQENEDTTVIRSAFLESRSKVTPASRRKPNKHVAQANRPSQPGGMASSHSNHATAIGVGYTIYRRRNRDDMYLVSVSPSTVFHYGDAIRIVLEPNADGYLYVFHRENEQEPTMIFPDARLNRGHNQIKAHVPYEVPSGMESDERLRWFYFDETPATERLYFVVTRNPMLGVPIGTNLISYCRTHAGACPLRPATDVWDLIRRTLEAPARTSLRNQFDEQQTRVEREAIARGFGLPKDAPEPSVVRVSASPGAQLLVTMVALIHR
jgi:hypothetical protein